MTFLFQLRLCFPLFYKCTNLMFPYPYSKCKTKNSTHSLELMASLKHKYHIH